MSLSRLIARIIMVPLGLFIAISLRNLFLALSAYSLVPSSGEDPIMLWFIASMGLMLSVGVIQVWGPCLLAALVCEVFSWRALWLYLIAGIGFSLIYVHYPASDDLDMTMNLQTLAGGLVGGFVYWLITGRGAGIVKRTLDNKPKTL